MSLATRLRNLAEGPVSSAILLLTGTIIVFGQTAWFGFVDWDDALYVNNPVVTSGFSVDGIKWALTTKFFGLWYPLTWLSHLLDTTLWGTWAGGHHLSSVLIHLGASLFLLAFLRDCGITATRAFLIAFIFALHPLRAESVAWVSERKDVLCLFWLMVCVWSHGRWARSDRKAYFAVSQLACLFAVMAKPLAIVAPFLLLLIDRWPLARSRSLGYLLIEKTGPVLFSVLSLGMAFLYDDGAQLNGTTPYLVELDWVEKVWLAGNAIWVQAFHQVWPVDLAFFHPIPFDNLRLRGGFGLAFLCLLLVLAYRERHRRPWVTVGILWYLIALAPSSGMLQISNSAYADRYSYLPSIGLLIALILSWPAASAPSRPVLTAAVASILLLMLTLSAWQVSHWRDTSAMVERALAINPDNHVARLKLAELLLEKRRLDEAEHHARLIGTPREGDVFRQGRIGLMGNIAFHRNDFTAASRYWREALSLGDGYAEAHFGLGTIALTLNDNATALFHFERALQGNSSRVPDLWNNYGIALLRMGLRAEAGQAFRRAVSIDPRNAGALFNLARLLEHDGNLIEGLRLYERAATLAPGNRQAIGGVWRIRARLSASGQG